MSSLLIYNDNISPDFIDQFKSHLGKVKSFVVSNQTLAKENYSFDLVVTEFLSNFQTYKYDVIFIPINLSSENYLEFSGLKIGYHIRMTKDFINQDTPIIFLGNEDVFEINKLTSLGEILFTPQVYLSGKMDIKSLISQVEFTKTIKSENVLEEFLKKIHIKPSGNYATHHSIANEWSIMRWTKALDLSNELNYMPDEIEKIEEKIGSNLYYKYLTCKFPINSVEGLTIEDLKLKYNGKILYIDDEIDKGWNELFCALLYDDIINKVENYESFGSNFIELSRNEIIELSVNKAKDFDLVILDFRLTEDDFYESDPKKITGYKILEGIKAYNEGIQVVIFSATNKVWNLQALQASGADGFIIKESPENSTDLGFTQESIKNIVSVVDNCLKMSFLKRFIENSKTIKLHFDENSDTTLNQLTNQIENNYSWFQREVINQITIAFDCLYNSNNFSDNNFKQKYLDLAHISIYKILELFNKKYIINPNVITNRYFGIQLDFNQNPSTLDKIAYVIQNNLQMDFHLVRNDLENYNTLRKNIIHPQGIINRVQIEDCIQFAQIIKQMVLQTN